MKKKSIAKRALSVSLSLALLLSMAACGSEEEDVDYGAIEDVEIVENEAEIEKQNVFNEVENSFDYLYQDVTAARGYMEFKVPANWTVEFENGRHIEINAPADDPYLPGQTIHVLYNYNYMNIYRDSVDEYDNIFVSDRAKLYYNIDGTLYRQYDHAVPSAIETDTSFTDRGDMLSTSIYRDFALTDLVMGTMPKEPCTGIYYNVKWGGTPCSFSTVCKEADEENIMALLRYMVSSITYVPQNVTSTYQATVGDITLTLPVELEQHSSMDNVFVASTYENTALTGLGVGVFEMADGELDLWSFAENEMKEMAKGFLPDSCDNMYSPYTDTYSISIDGKATDIFYATASIHNTETDACKYYPTGSTCMMYFYALPGDGKTRDVICLWFQDDQTDLAITMMDMIKNKTKIK